MLIWNTYILCLLGLVLEVGSFMPNGLSQCARPTEVFEADFTHQSIITNVLRNHLKSNTNLTDTLQDYVIDAILDGSNYLDKIKFDVASNHFNGEQILKANEKLITLKQEITNIHELESQYSYDAIRHLIGQYLHLLQDFYSNTDWVETFKDKDNETAFYRLLGVSNEGFLKVLPKEKPACIGVGDDPFLKSGSQFNLAKINEFITSGYRFDQDISKPPGRVASFGGQGKCSHGGVHDNSTYAIPTGGINSESFNYSLSPKYLYHRSSSMSAAAASYDFLQSDLIKTLDFGKDVVQHTCFLLTQSLQILSLSESWALSISDQLYPFPWNIFHLYTAHGDRVGGPASLQTETLLSEDPVTLSPNSMLLASLNIPEYSSLVTVIDKNAVLFSEQDTNILEKALIARHITLVVFSLHGSTSGTIKAMAKICESTQGNLFAVKEPADVINILYNIKPSRHQSHYMPNGQGIAYVPALPGVQLQLMVNCLSDKPVQVPVASIDGSVSIKMEVSTDLTSIYTISSKDQKLILISVELATDIMNVTSECSVIGWHQTSAPAIIRPVIVGPRDELFDTSVGVPGRGKLMVRLGKNYRESVFNVTIEKNGEQLNLQRCLYDVNREGTAQEYLTDSLPTDFSPAVVRFKMSQKSILMKYLIPKQSVEFNGEYIVKLNEPTNIILTSWIKASYILSALSPEELLVQVSPSNFESTKGQTHNVSVTVTAIPGKQAIHRLRPVLVMAKGDTGDSGESIAYHKLLVIRGDEGDETRRDETRPNDSSKPVTTTEKESELSSTITSYSNLVDVFTSTSDTDLSTTSPNAITTGASTTGAIESGETSTSADTTTDVLHSTSTETVKTSKASMEEISSTTRRLTTTSSDSASTTVMTTGLEKMTTQKSTEITSKTGINSESQSQFIINVVAYFFITLIPIITIPIVALVIYMIMNSCDKETDPEKANPEKTDPENNIPVTTL